MNEEIIRALNANTAALHEQADAMRQHSAALAAQTAEIKSLRRFLEHITEDHQSGAHIGAKQAINRLERIANTIAEACDKMDCASQRMTNTRAIDRIR